jgi:hypothetical protein
MGACTQSYAHCFSAERRPRREDYADNPYAWRECLPIIGGKVQWPSKAQLLRDYGDASVDSWDWPRDGFLIRIVSQFRCSTGFGRMMPDGRRLTGPMEDPDRIKDRAESLCNLIATWEMECCLVEEASL